MRQLIWVRGNWKYQTSDLILLSKYKREPGAWNKHVPFQGNNHNSTSDFYKNLLVFVIINLKIPTCRWFLILQLSPWVLHKPHSQARGGWSSIFFLLPFSIFPSFSSFFQVSRLLPAYNLNLNWTTSDPEHKEHTYFSYLLWFWKFVKKNFHFRLFLKFWTEVEGYLLKNTEFTFESSPQDWWSMSPLPCLWSYPRPCYHHISPVLTCSCRLSSDRDEPGRKREHHGSSLLPGSQGPGIQGRWCGPGSAKRGNSKKEHWAPPLQSLLSSS